MFYIFIHQGVVKQVPDDGIPLVSEMDLVSARQSGLLPLFHRLKPAHNVEKVPKATPIFAAQAEERLPRLQTISVDGVNPPSHPLVAVIVGDEDKGAIWVDRLNPGN